MAAEMKKITVKHIAENLICETCLKLEQLKDKVRESGETQSCMCTCGAAQAWPANATLSRKEVHKRCLK